MNEEGQEEHAVNAAEETAPVTQVSTGEEKPALAVSLDTRVTIRVYRDVEGQPEDEVQAESTINLWVLANKLADMAEEVGADKDEKQEWKFEVSVKGTLPDGTESDAVIMSGPAMQVIQAALDQLLPSPIAASMMFNMMQEMLKSTQMRGLLVTALFENKQPTAFAMVNHTLGDLLTDDDIDALAYNAQANVEMFRSKMRAQGHEFPDESRIITPSGARTKQIIV